MSNSTYSIAAKSESKVLIWLGGTIATPPFSEQARREAGFLLRLLQQGVLLALPQSRPLPTIGTQCHELRIHDGDSGWRVIYRIEPDAILILDIFAKKTQTTPRNRIELARSRLARYLKAIE